MIISNYQDSWASDYTGHFKRNTNEISDGVNTYVYRSPYIRWPVDISNIQIYMYIHCTKDKILLRKNESMSLWAHDICTSHQRRCDVDSTLRDSWVLSSPIVLVTLIRSNGNQCTLVVKNETIIKISIDVNSYI